MRRLSLPLALFVLFSLPSLAGTLEVEGSTALEPLIASATGIERSVDSGLQQRAAVRAVQIQTDFSHCCIGSGEAEIIAWNRSFSDPLGQLVIAWLGSPAHAAILWDRAYTRIGCGTAVSGDRTYGVCLLAVPGAQAPPAPIVPPVTELPDAAME